MGPNSASDIFVQWTAQGGAQKLQGSVDRVDYTTGRPFKNTAPEASQIKEITLNVPSPVKVEATALTITPANPKSGDQVSAR